MTATDHAPLDQELRQTLAELELCSHVSALDYETKDAGRSAEDAGGKRPPGGIDRREDRALVDKDPKNPERVLRSAGHYRRRLQRAHSDRTKRVILDEAKASLAAWRQRVPMKDPAKDDPGWKRFIAESKESYKALANRYGVTTARISQIRKDYDTPEPKIRRRVRTQIFSVGCSNCGTPDCAPHSDMCEPCLEFGGVRESETDPFKEMVA
jgi:hypothetical protein